ncbi:MAG: KH domain-containing protein [Christensenellaceae bacterium]|nr:KH domain-containing protein [Christensenellaceae bacterium]
MSERNVKKLVEFMAKSLVTKPEEVTIQETESSEGIILELRVATEDMGKVIGKQGRIAKAIRTVVKASTGRDDKPVFVEIVD